MKKILFALVLPVLLCACGTLKADVPDNPQARQAAALAEAYIQATITYDAAGYLELLSEDYVYMDYGANDGPLTRGNYDYFIGEVFSQEAFKIKARSYSVTPDGRFAVLLVKYAQESSITGKWPWVECVCVLEMADGKILNETWYYNGDRVR